MTADTPKAQRPLPRWRLLVPGEGVLRDVAAWTKGEARAQAKRLLRLSRLPAGTRAEREETAGDNATEVMRP